MGAFRSETNNLKPSWTPFFRQLTFMRKHFPNPVFLACISVFHRDQFHQLCKSIVSIKSFVQTFNCNKHNQHFGGALFCSTKQSTWLMAKNLELKSTSPSLVTRNKFAQDDQDCLSFLELHAISRVCSTRWKNSKRPTLTSKVQSSTNGIMTKIMKCHWTGFESHQFTTAFWKEPKVNNCPLKRTFSCMAATASC